MTPNQTKLVQKSWAKVNPKGDEVAALFYKTLFELDPSLVPLFKGDMKQQGRKLIDMISAAVSKLDRLDELVPVVQRLGEGHAEYGVENSHYDTVGEALLQTLEEGLQEAFTKSTRTAWVKTYTLLASTMKDAAASKKENKSDKDDQMNARAKTDSDSNTSFYSAINNALTAIMMVDRDLNVTFLNKSTLELLKKHESTFQTVWPNFKATEDFLMGNSIDQFHKDPSHQRRLLSNPGNLPYRTDIRIADLTVELNVTAIVDASGEYVGNTLEWSDVTANRAQESKSTQLQGAIDQSGTAQVMVDRDFIITYANQATLDLLKQHEATFQKKYPGFSAKPEAILGTCIDTFHKNPAHQRKLLDDPSNLPWKTDIKVEHLSFELNVTAINDAQGNYMGNALEWQDVTEQRAQENKSAQLQGAIDQSGTAQVMVDRDFIITYANQATLDLLKQHEATFQKKYPGFSAKPEAILGTCIDTFHKNPAHQRKLLDDPSNLPWKTDIKVEHLSFELNVTAITDAQGNYMGNALEWQDVTEQRAQEDKSAQLQGAIDQSGTAQVMVDRDFIITYANQATLDLLKQHEATFQKKYPGFSAKPEAVLGACIDTFHKNPAHQRKLLDDPSNLPWKTDIQVEHLSFELNVTAITDAQGNYIGNALEWQDVTEARTRQIEVGRLSSAVDGMTTNVMMADKSGNIVYMNPSVTAMLRKREEKLRTVLPAFDVNRLVGTNFDTFHKNPAHQQNLLGNPANMPFQADISVAGLDFNLTAIALLDDNGNHLGSAVQWIDTTEEKDAQRQIEGLIKAAIDGELDKRIDTSTYDGFMQGLGEGINGLMNAIVEPINSAIDVTRGLAQGDLNKEMDGEYSGEFLALASAVNESMTNLRDMVGEIRTASSSVFSAASEISQGNTDLNQRTEAQASSLEETASAMEELTTTVQQNAENATEATRMASGAMEKASSGGEVVQSAVSAMEEINKSSKKIADIIGVIDEIAFQTNLLALNAAVEAARAGEQGRGFAVVAAEVRNLAQRSAAAAKEIKGLINDSVEAVGKGTKLVDETGQTFSELVGAVQGVVTMISDIDSASKEQASGIAEVSQAVTQMDEMTQQNAALVEEASAASKTMEDQAQSLLEQVDFFQTGEDERASRTVSARAAHKPEKQRPVASRRNKKAKDEEWETF